MASKLLLGVGKNSLVNERRDASGAQAGDRLRPPRYRLLPRDSDYALTVCFEQRLALGIVLSRELVVVPSAAVGLNDDVIPGPPKIWHDPPTIQVDRLVDIWMLKPSTQEQIEHDVLEHAARGGGTGGDDECELSRTTTAPEPREDLDKLLDAHELERLRSTRRASELVPG